MIVIRQTHSAARRLPPGRLVLLLPLLVAFLAACGPGRGGGPAY